MTIRHTQTQPAELILEEGQPFWLEDDDGLWRVQEGLVNIYAITAAGSEQYRQVFLFTAEPGHPLFALSSALCQGQSRLLAVSSGGAVLKVLSRSGFLATAAAGGEHLFEVIWFMIEEWLSRLLTVPDYVAMPRSFQLLEAGSTTRLEPGKKVRAGQDFVWARVQNGEVRYGRLPDFTLPTEMSIPLHSQSWLAARVDGGGANVCGLSTDQVFLIEKATQPDAFWQVLDECHQLFAVLIDDYFAAETRRDSMQLAARRRQREKLLYSASAHLLQSDVPEAMPQLVAAEQYHSPLLGAIQAIAGNLGVPAEQVRLPKGLENSRQDGAAVQQIARVSGMQVRLIRREKGWQHQDNGPMLAYWGKQRQPVALLPASMTKYRIFFPAEAVERECTERDMAELAEEAYMFYSGLPGKSPGLAGWIKLSLRKSWANDFWTIIWASLAAGIIPTLTPFVTETIFTDLIPLNDRQGHVMVIQVMMVAAFASAGVSLTRGVAFLRVKGRSRLAGEAALWMRLLSMPAAFFRQYEAGDLAQRMNAISQIGILLSDSVLTVLFNGLFSVCSLAVMFYYSWKLALGSAALLALYLFIVIVLLWKMVDYRRRMVLAAGRVAGQGLQVLNGLSKFRMQGAEAQAFYLWAREFGEEWKWNRATRWKANWLEMVNTVQPILMSMLVFWLTMHWMEAADKGSTQFISQAEFLSFNAALAGFTAAVVAMVPVLTNLLDIIPNLERLRPILETAPEVSEDKAEAGELTGQIEVSNLCFRYGADKPPVLHNVSFKVRPGQFVAIVGSSGSGKSTLLRLLLGFEQPDSGAVFFDGQDIAELSATSVRSQMGVVLQHGQLMAGDIFTNIVGSLPLTLDDAWQATEMVGLADDIRAMPMGMHTMVSEGAANISGGQRQRILIARSIVNRPRIIVFDEATSALDNRTQAIVTAALDKLKATRIIVAHRLSTISNANVIYVMEKGRIVESGNYEELMEMNGLFAALARRQMI